MDRSLPYDLGIGTVTGVISAVVLGIVAIVWKRIKNMRNISMGQPENPVAGEQFVIDMTSRSPPTSSPFSSPPTCIPDGSPFSSPDSSPFNRKHLTSSSPPTSPTPSFGPVASIPLSHGQEGIERCVTDNNSISPPASPTPSFGSDAIIRPRFSSLAAKRGGTLPPRRGGTLHPLPGSRMGGTLHPGRGHRRVQVRPTLKYLVESIRQGLRLRRPIDHEE